MPLPRLNNGLTRCSHPVTAFARKTGDLSVLSSADIRVLALCLTLELEENGTWRVRDHPGQVLTGSPKEEKDGKGKGKDKEADEASSGDEKGDEADGLSEKVEKLDVAGGEAAKEVEQGAEATSISGPSSSDAPAASSSTAPSAPSTSSPAPASTSAASASSVPTEVAAANDADDDDVWDAESDSSAGSWITPDNVYSHKVRDLGLFEAPAGSSSSTSAAAPRPKTIMKAAVLTGDFAMQNVALQMGLNVLGSGGKRVREVRTWVLRCHACFK